MLKKILILTILTWFVNQQNAFSEISRPSLTLGSRGTVVNELQAALKLWGYYEGSVNGIYSESSAIAVSRFQEAAGLPVTGIVDSQTWKKLFPSPPSAISPPNVNTSNNNPPPNNSQPKPSNNPNNNNNQTVASLPLLREGMEGDAVKKLQTQLKKLGFYPGVIDGIFGAETLKAVIAAQTHFGINADGIVGTATWQKLLNP